MAEHLRRYAEETGESIVSSTLIPRCPFLDGIPPIYDVVFVDIELPDLNGIEAARRLRGAGWRRLPHFRDEYGQVRHQRLCEVNALDYFLKPCSIRILEMRMERIRRGQERDAYSLPCRCRAAHLGFRRTRSSISSPQDIT